MTVALKLCVGILWWLATAQADVSHLGYRRYKGERLRLQRLEAEPTPYPAAGYRPNRDFGLPHEQPLFPHDTQHSSRPSGSNGFNNLGGEDQRPQLTYGSPEPRFRPQNRPQTFNNVPEPREQVYVVRYHQRQPAATGVDNFERPSQSQNTNGDFDNSLNNFAEAQQYDLEEQTTISNYQPPSGYNNLPVPQQPDSLYGLPTNQQQETQTARLKQQLIARLQKAERLEKLQLQQQQAESQRYRQTQSQILQTQKQQQQQFVNSPQAQHYSIPFQKLQVQAESQTSHVIARKPARLTDNREETEPEEIDAKTAETEEIETTTKANDKKTVTQTAVTTPVTVNNPGVVGYYPAAAVGFVQPLNPAAAYIAAANYNYNYNYPTLQPFSAGYTVGGSPYFSQQYVYAADPAAQLKAW